MNPIRVGVVGVGYLGRFHAEKYTRMRGVELVGVVDRIRSKADAVAQELDVPVFDRIDDLCGKVDAVSIVTPTSSHFEVAKVFLEHDTHLFVEKPITSTIEEADALIQMAARVGKVIQVGHIERFNPAFRAMPAEGLAPFFIEAHRISGYKERALDVSVVIDLMIHDLDLVLNLVQRPVEKILANGAAVVTPHIDIANARIAFEGGCVANITASRVALRAARKFRVFHATGYDGIDFGARQLISARRDPNVVDGPIPGMAVSLKTLEEADALETELDGFVKAIRTGRQPDVTGIDGRKALAMAIDIEKEINRTAASFRAHLGKPSA